MACLTGAGDLSSIGEHKIPTQMLVNSETGGLEPSDSDGSEQQGVMMALYKLWLHNNRQFRLSPEVRVDVITAHWLRQTRVYYSHGGSHRLRARG
jgi:hypothetical protein